MPEYFGNGVNGRRNVEQPGDVVFGEVDRGHRWSAKAL
jgi:hypothetical protein